MNILTEYFKLELDKAGYEDLVTDKLSWSLGRFQSDNIEMESQNFSDKNALLLCERLMSGTLKSAIKRAIRKDVVFSAGGSYDAETYYSENFEYTEIEERACEQFCSMITHDLIDLENRLCEEGNVFLEATPDEDEPKIEIDRTLGRFRLVVQRVNSPYWDFHFGCHYKGYYTDEAMDLVKSIIHNNVSYFDIEMSLYNLDVPYGDAISMAYYGNCTLGEDESFKAVYCNDFIRDRLSELVSEARSILGRRVPEREKIFLERRLELEAEWEKKAEIKKIAKIALQKKLEEKEEQRLKILAEEKRQLELEKMGGWLTGLCLNNSVA